MTLNDLILLPTLSVKILGMLGLEPRASYMLGRHSTKCTALPDSVSLSLSCRADTSTQFQKGTAVELNLSHHLGCCLLGQSSSLSHKIVINGNWS